MKNDSPLESDEQKVLVQYLKLKKIMYFAVPNGAMLKGNKLQRARQMAKLKSEGLVPGTSDIIAMLPSKILFIEMKRVKGSSTTKEQKEFIEKIKEFNYAEGRVCKGARAAIDFIEENKI